MANPLILSCGWFMNTLLNTKQKLKRSIYRYQMQSGPEKWKQKEKHEQEQRQKRIVYVCKVPVSSSKAGCPDVRNSDTPRRQHRSPMEPDEYRLGRLRC